MTNPMLTMHISSSAKPRPRILYLCAAAAVAILICISHMPLKAQSPSMPPPNAPVIVDTDVGADDLMAIAFLLSRKDVNIEAICVANGLAHVQNGAQNVLRLLTLAGRENIPVYLGATHPLSGAAEFPREWRKIADEMPGVTLPAAAKAQQTEAAAGFLTRRLSDREHPVRILALGPLTNLAQALDHVPDSSRAPIELVVMGGALHVPGNLGDGGVYKTKNTTAEWNIIVDPAAAQKVFALGGTEENPTLQARPLRIRIVPLDATQQVPIDSQLLASIAAVNSPLARVVAQLLNTNNDLVQAHAYFAWDPLAAVALVEPSVAQTQCTAIQVRQSGAERGRIVEAPGRAANVCIALGADRRAFENAFLAALASH